MADISAADRRLPRRLLVTAPHCYRRVLLASTALLICGAEGALAQPAPDPNVTVQDRPRPEYDPLGVRAGAFLLSPELAVTESYTDNAGFDEDDEQADFVTQIEPSLEARSDWSVHELGVVVGADIAIYAEESDEDYQDIFAVADGRLDVSRQTNVIAEGQVRQTHQGRDDPEDEGGDLVDVFQYGGALGAEHEFNRLILGLRGEVLRNDFEEAAEDDRDNHIYNALLRLGYEVSPRLDVFTEGRYVTEVRDDDVDDAGIDRDTDGYEARLGAGVDLTSVLFGEFFAGYRVQRFDEPGFDDETGVSFGVDLNWNPTLLTSVGISGLRDFQPTDEADAVSNFRTEFGVTIDHELWRNLIVGAEAAYQNDDFKGSGQEDNTIVLGVGTTYWLNRNIAFNAGYQFSDRSSNVDGEEFTVNEVSVGIALRL
jgi:hypothetical protein